MATNHQWDLADRILSWFQLILNPLVCGNHPLNDLQRDHVLCLSIKTGSQQFLPQGHHCLLVLVHLEDMGYNFLCYPTIIQLAVLLECAFH